MSNEKMKAQMSDKGGFIAALDQSGGSTPGALRLYGVADRAYSGEAEMFRLVHEMRVRIMASPAFSGEKVSPPSCSSARWTERRRASRCRRSCGRRAASCHS